MTNALSITLYLTEGSSDKVYAAQLSEKGHGWVVNFHYGRRGSSLTAGTKTPEPMDYAKAQRIYEKLVSEKTAKGYTPAESGDRYQDTAKAGRATGVAPQLLNPIEEREIEAILSDDAFCAQEKYDGERRMVIISDEGIVGTNRNGLIVPISKTLEEALSTIVTTGRTVIDGEDLGDAGYVPFDVLEVNGRDVRSMAYGDRLALLDTLLSETSAFIGKPFLYRGTACKRELLRQLKERNAEGIVFKRVDAPWNEGRPNSGGNALKFKFVATATVLVALGREGKRSMEMRVVDEDGSLRPVGNVTIPANAAVPAIGTCIEVRYLYRVGDGALFQPVFVRPRSDKSEPDIISSLKLKAA